MDDSEQSDILQKISDLFNKVGWQMECFRRLQCIREDLHEFRIRALIHQNVRDELIEPKEALQRCIGSLVRAQSELDEFVLPLYEGDLSVLALRLEGLHRCVLRELCAAESLADLAKAVGSVEEEFGSS